MKTNLSTKLTRAIGLAVLFTPVLAQAHPGHSSGLAAGVAHPFTGLDHLAAMLAVGLWAAQLKGRARILVPIAFVVPMFIGGMLGISGMAAPGVEQGIVASLFVFGLLVAFATRLPLAAALTLTGGFALLHGLAHGSELPLGANSAAYGIGFVLSTLGLQAIGFGFGAMAMRAGRPGWVRFAGAAVVLAGVLTASGPF